MGKLRDPRAVDPLIPLLKDPKKQVRKNAAWALGIIGDDRAVATLTASLDDPDGDVRTATREALDAIKKKRT